MSDEVMDILKVIQQSNLQLISVADQKAGVLLGANIILISIFAGYFVHNKAHFMTVTPLLLSFTIVIFAIRSLMPRVNASKELPSNVMFFKEIIRYKYTDYVDLIQNNFEDNQYRREVLINNIYQICLIADSKFKNLFVCYRLCYVFFVYVLFVFFLIYLKIIPIDTVASMVKINH